MKKITLLTLTLLSTIFSTAQNSYTFSASQGTYTDLVDPISINNDEAWNFNQYDPIAIPFSFSVFNESFSHFMFFYDGFFLVKSSSADFLLGQDIDPYIILTPISAYIQDKNYPETGSLSPLSYKIEGTTGNRILKIEIKNAGLQVELWEEDTLNSYVNYQIWLYEGTNKIEYHFGPSFVTNLSYLNGEDFIYSLFAINSTDFFKSTFLSGLGSNPTYNEYTDPEANPGNGLTSLPLDGQIYTFNAGTLSTKNENENSFKLFPIPTENELNISLTDITDYNYTIYDILGKKVLSGEIKNSNEFSINTANLTPGSYLIKINNTVQKFIKK